ncbi:polygalacturonase inhibitor-like [Iris pallida]|uniref:Polygalacturonase inhibitor-like n=1 Tax=Iris pallida TaxID=29817 RepID=A0AAX6GB88_IRIPA|nr:polygalacturonase inhibitor-like [Iris pallida]
MPRSRQEGPPRLQGLLPLHLPRRQVARVHRLLLLGRPRQLRLTTGRVTSLYFFNDNNSVSLNGSIPAAVGDLSALDTIWFSDLPPWWAPSLPS